MSEMEIQIALQELQNLTRCSLCNQMEEEMVIFHSCGHSFCVGCQVEKKCGVCGSSDLTMLSSDKRMSSIISLIRSLQFSEIMNGSKVKPTEIAPASFDETPQKIVEYKKLKPAVTPVEGSLDDAPAASDTRSTKRQSSRSSSRVKKVDAPIRNSPASFDEAPATKVERRKLKPAVSPVKGSLDDAPPTSDTLSSTPQSSRRSSRVKRVDAPIRNSPASFDEAPATKVEHRKLKPAVSPVKSSLDDTPPTSDTRSSSPQSSRRSSRVKRFDAPIRNSPASFDEVPVTSKTRRSTTTLGVKRVDTPIRDCSSCSDEIGNSIQSRKRGRKNSLKIKTVVTPIKGSPVSVDEAPETGSVRNNKRGKKKSSQVGTPVDLEECATTSRSSALHNNSSTAKRQKPATPSKLPERSSLRIICSKTASEGLSQEILESSQACSLDLTPKPPNSPMKTSLWQNETPKLVEATLKSAVVSNSPSTGKTPLRTSYVKKTSHVSPNKKINNLGETELHLAAKKANLAEVRRLLLARCDPNVQDYAKWTPLHEAVLSGSIPVIACLIDGGAVVNACGHCNRTPLHLAVAGDPRRLVAAVTKKRSRDGHAEVNPSFAFGGSVPIAKLLLRHGADPLAKDLSGDTPRSLVEKLGATDEWLFFIAAEKVTVPLKMPPAPEITVLDLNLSSEGKAIFDKFADRFNVNVGVNTIKNLYKATHFIVPDNVQCEAFSWALARAVSRGAYIVRASWLKACLEHDELLDKEPYEVVPTWLPGLKASQENRRFVRPGLFSGCYLMIGGPKSDTYNYEGETLCINDIISFVEWADGKIIYKRMPDPDAPDLMKAFPYHAEPGSAFENCTYIVVYLPGSWEVPIKYNMAHFKCLSFNWLMDSIKTFKFAPY